MEALPDDDLVRLACEGRTAAFAILVSRYRESLIKISMRYIDDYFSAEDVVQDTFLKAFEKLTTFQFRSAFKSWLFRIAINTAKNKLRKRKPTVDYEKVVLKVAPKCESGVIDRQLHDIVRTYVDELPRKQKRALELRAYQEMSFRQVADEMNCPYDTAKANYRHGLLKIRDKVVGLVD